MLDRIIHLSRYMMLVVFSAVGILFLWRTVHRFLYYYSSSFREWAYPRRVAVDWDAPPTIPFDFPYIMFAVLAILLSYGLVSRRRWFVGLYWFSALLWDGMLLRGWSDLRLRFFPGNLDIYLVFIVFPITMGIYILLTRKWLVENKLGTI